MKPNESAMWLENDSEFTITFNLNGVLFFSWSFNVVHKEERNTVECPSKSDDNFINSQAILRISDRLGRAAQFALKKVIAADIRCYALASLIKMENVECLLWSYAANRYANDFLFLSENDFAIACSKVSAPEQILCEELEHFCTVCMYAKYFAAW